MTDKHPLKSMLPTINKQTFDNGAAMSTGALAAGIALFDPIAGILSAGLAPYVTTRLSQIYESRLQMAAERLKEMDVDIEAALSTGPDAVLKADILRDYLFASADTASAEKIKLLLHMLKYGLTSDVRLEVLYARRVVRTVSRIDELEMLILAKLTSDHKDLDGTSLIKLGESAFIADFNILRSGLAVLESEGLVESEKGDLFRVSDYGATLLRELSEATTVDSST